MLKLYNIPNTRETAEGWAIIVIDTELGLFTTVSDWGNYGYLWSSPGKEFRAFLLGLNLDYVRSKLLTSIGVRSQHVFDGAATKKAIREAVEEKGPGWEWYEWEIALLQSSMSEEGDYDAWQSETHLEEPWGFGVFVSNHQVTAFCENVFMTRFKDLLRAELEAEKQADKDVQTLRDGMPAIRAAVQEDIKRLKGS